MQRGDIHRGRSRCRDGPCTRTERPVHHCARRRCCYCRCCSCDDGQENVSECLRGQRLRQYIVHARFHAHALVLQQRRGSDGDDRKTSDQTGGGGSGSGSGHRFRSLARRRVQRRWQVRGGRARGRGGESRAGGGASGGSSGRKGRRQNQPGRQEHGSVSTLNLTNTLASFHAVHHS